MPLHIVPDYIIYDELKKERQRKSRDNRPRLEVPKYVPMWPEDEHDEHSEAQDEQERGEVIIPMF